MGAAVQPLEVQFGPGDSNFDLPRIGIGSATAFERSYFFRNHAERLFTREERRSSGFSYRECFAATRCASTQPNRGESASTAHPCPHFGRPSSARKDRME